MMSFFLLIVAFETFLRWRFCCSAFLVKDVVNDAPFRGVCSHEVSFKVFNRRMSIALRVFLQLVVGQVIVVHDRRLAFYLANA